MAAEARPVVLLAVPPHPDARALLEQEASVMECGVLTEAAIIAAAQEAEGLLIRHKPLCTEALMAGCPRLRVIGRYGAGLDTVDLAAATRVGVAIVHAPDANAPAAAEHALMLMLHCVKNTRVTDRMARAGDWRQVRYQGITELRGKTLGIIGVGRIGRTVAQLAAAFGMRRIGFDIALPADELRRRGVEPADSLEALLAASDVVTCHTPLTERTRRLIDRAAVARMKRGAIFINTSRGGVHDEAALYEALVDGRLRAAGLDVWEQEPPSPDNPLFRLDQVVCTPHVAGVTEEADRAIALQVTGEMLRVLRGDKPEALANPEVWPRPLQRL
jgi:D-3-phosphoglycerate dehydrogenase